MSLSKQRENAEGSFEYPLLVLFLITCLLSLTLPGCTGDDGGQGPAGSDGTDGTSGTACWDLNENGVKDVASEDINGDDTVDVGDCQAAGGGNTATSDLSDSDVLAQMIDDENVIQAELNNIDISSPPVVDFFITDSSGTPLVGLAANQVSFTLAKLLPAASGLPNRWQNYVNTLEEITLGSPSPNLLDISLQASRDSGGTLVDNEDGSYQYTFATDVTDVTSPVAVAWEPDLTHRVGMEIRINSAINPDNPVLTFVPDGSAVTVTKDMAATATCNKCHNRLAVHGGARFNAQYCVTCHNPGTRDQDYGELLDLSHMVHAIHGASVRSDPFIVYGRSEASNGDPNDFSEVTYPQSPLFCETCHEETVSQPDGDNWKTTVTAQACGGCHVNGLNAGAADVDTGLSTYSFVHVNLGNLEADNNACASCHYPGTGISWEGRAIAAEDSHLQGVKAAAAIADEQFEFQILDVQDVDAGDFPVVTFKVMDPSNDTAYDIKNDPEFIVANGAGMNIRLAWGTTDYDNEGSGSATGAAAGTPAQPIGISLATLKANSVDNGDGSFTITSATALPSPLSGPLSVIIDGHPVKDVDGDGGVDDTVPVKSIVYYPTDERRQVVDIANCNQCHEKLSLHGSNRNDAPQVCVACHNPDATDVNRRAGAGVNWGAVSPADGKGEQGIAFSYLIHSIHSAHMVVYGFGGSVNDFSEVTFPGDLTRCTTCHVEGTFYHAPEGAHPMTVGTGADRRISDDDEAISPTTAACYACHTSSSATAHMEQMGGVIEDGDPNTSSDPGVTAEGGRPLKADIGSTPDSTEACATCHGEGRIADTAVVHGVE